MFWLRASMSNKIAHPNSLTRTCSSSTEFIEMIRDLTSGHWKMGLQFLKMHPTTLIAWIRMGIGLPKFGHCQPKPSSLMLALVLSFLPLFCVCCVVELECASSVPLVDRFSRPWLMSTFVGAMEIRIHRKYILHSQENWLQNLKVETVFGWTVKTQLFYSLFLLKKRPHQRTHTKGADLIKHAKNWVKHSELLNSTPFLVTLSTCIFETMRNQPAILLTQSIVAILLTQSIVTDFRLEHTLASA